MTLIDKLPLIRGWAYHWEPLGPVSIQRNKAAIIYNPPPPSKELGWLLSLQYTSNDAYMGIRVVMPGVDTGYGTFAQNMIWGNIIPGASAGFRMLTLQYVFKYWQPNPLRTWGSFGAIVEGPAYPEPFYGPVRIYASLLGSSTQSQASIEGGFSEIIVQDRNLFLKDLRQVMYGRWGPLMDLIGHTPILRLFAKKFEENGIPCEEMEKVEPPGIAR